MLQFELRRSVRVTNGNYRFVTLLPGVCLHHSWVLFMYQIYRVFLYTTTTTYIELHAFFASGSVKTLSRHCVLSCGAQQCALY